MVLALLQRLSLLDNAELHIEDNSASVWSGVTARANPPDENPNREQGLDDGRIIYEQDLSGRATVGRSATQCDRNRL